MGRCLRATSAFRDRAGTAWQRWCVSPSCSWRRRQLAKAAMRGTNAAVVGILGAALYNPVWTRAVLSPRDFAVALAGFLLLTVWKLAPWIAVVLLGTSGAILRLI